MVTTFARRSLAWFGRLSWAGGLLAVFAVSAYLAFGLFVRRGVTRVPELRGLAEEKAIEILAEQGLVLRRAPQGLYDESVAVGLVLRQTPGAGSLVKRDGVVEVALSLGQQLVRMPDLRGQSLPAAQATLVAAGLALGETPGLFVGGPDQTPGAVMLQDPPPGGYVDRSRPVKLYLGLEQGFDRAFVMPDVVAHGYERTRRFFEARGFRFGSVKLEPYEGAPPGIVLRQFPRPGHPLRHHDAISLVVSAPSTTGP